MFGGQTFRCFRFGGARALGKSLRQFSLCACRLRALAGCLCALGCLHGSLRALDGRFLGAADTATGRNVGCDANGGCNWRRCTSVPGHARDRLLSDGFGRLARLRLLHARPDIIKPVRCDSTSSDRPNHGLRTGNATDGATDHLKDAEPRL
jgi:hypothetical protein